MGNNSHSSESWRFDNSRAHGTREHERKHSSDIRVHREKDQIFPSYRTEDDEIEPDVRNDPIRPTDPDKNTLMDILTIGAGVLAAFVVGYIVFILFF